MKKIIAGVATAAVLGGGIQQAVVERQYVVWSQSQLHAEKVSESWLATKIRPSDEIVEPVMVYHTMLACSPGPGVGQAPPCCQPCDKPDIPDVPDIPDQPGSQQVDWGVQKLKALEAQKVNNGSTIIIGIADTGVDARHPDLKVKGGANFTGGNQSDYGDRAGHGTHCSGLATGVNNKIGYVGSSQAQLLMAKVLDDQGSGTNDSIANGVVWLARQGAKVISLSLGGPQASQAIAQAVRFAQQSGAVVVAAAGNNGNSQVMYPAGYQGVIAVSAMDKSGQKAHFSSYGSHIAMTAPGVDTISTCIGGKYCPMSGTSMATPLAAGVIALSLATGKPLKYQAMGNPQFFGKGLPDALATVQ